jgi:ABC-type polysaccharide transport system permease subunit
VGGGGERKRERERARNERRKKERKEGRKEERVNKKRKKVQLIKIQGLIWFALFDYYREAI